LGAGAPRLPKLKVGPGGVGRAEEMVGEHHGLQVPRPGPVGPWDKWIEEGSQLSGSPAGAYRVNVFRNKRTGRTMPTVDETMRGTYDRRACTDPRRLFRVATRHGPVARTSTRPPILLSNQAALRASSSTSFLASWSGLYVVLDIASTLVKASPTADGGCSARAPDERRNERGTRPG
jgi:hypothetical protein